MSIIDDELRARFGELRDDDRASAPAFPAMRAAADARAKATVPARRLALLWTAVAAGVVLAAGVAIRVSHDRDRLHRATASVPSISTWRSPTASLLPTSSTALLTQSSIFPSILDGALAP
jgi:uncharacterized protein HemX